MKITRVEIKNYRNIDDVHVDLNTSCNYIIGENNLGKSNFLRVLEIVCSGKSFEDDDYFDVNLPIEIVLKIKLDACELGFFDDNFDVNDCSIIDVKYEQKISEVYPTVLCINTNDSIPIKKLRKLNYCRYESTASPIKELKFSGKKGLGQLLDGFVEWFVTQNDVTSFINQNQIDELIRYVNTNFSHISVFKKYGIKVSGLTDTSEIINSLFYLSDSERKLDSTGSGTQYIAMASVRILCYIMELYRSKSIPFEERLFTNEGGNKILPIILSIDEPEVHLHPYLQRSLIGYYKRILANKDDDFRKLLKECFHIDGIFGQIIIVTHSTDALVGDYRNLVRFYKNDGKINVVSGCSQEVHIPDAKEKHLIMHFPELKEAFYSHCAILIEGATEYGCIRAFADKLGVPLDDLGICVINANGQSSIKPLMQLLEVFEIPSVAIYDGDAKGNKTPSDREFFTSEIFFEVEIVKKLFSTGNQKLARDIALELDDKALTQVLDEDFAKKYFKKINVSLSGYVPKSLDDVMDDDEEDFCNFFSAWFTSKKGILLGRIIGEMFSIDLIPKCYSNAIYKAQEISENAK